MPTEQIGPYHLLDKLGEGGIGEVWLAEQKEPVKRKFALKVIKQGMDTKQVVARFAAEKAVIHRDLKPGNVLVTIQDDRPGWRVPG